MIGTGGKVIREITETTGCKIDIEDDGTIKVGLQIQELPGRETPDAANSETKKNDHKKKSGKDSKKR